MYQWNCMRDFGEEARGRRSGSSCPASQWDVGPRWMSNKGARDEQNCSPRASCFRRRMTLDIVVAVRIKNYI